MKAVILAGGTGTRLWPMSRDLKPKQFHAFVSGSTMLQQTYARLSFLNPEDIYVATNVQYEGLVKSQLKNLKLENLIIEPAMRDTGPCICFAAHELKKRGFESEVMVIVYADHLMQKPDEFEKAVKEMACHVKQEDCLGVVAVRAKYPNVNLGYIRIGKLLKEVDSGLEIYELERFVEKPDVETASKFLSSYKFLWNTGLYMWRVSSILEKFRELAPEIYRATEKAATYEKAPKISIDYSLVERVLPKEIHVIPADLGWNDIGNWAALHEEFARKQGENISKGNHLSIDTQGSVVVSSSDRLIVTYGLTDMVIVDTPESLLIMPKNKAAQVKRVVEEIKQNKQERYL